MENSLFLVELLALRQDILLFDEATFDPSFPVAQIMQIRLLIRPSRRSRVIMPELLISYSAQLFVLQTEECFSCSLISQQDSGAYAEGLPSVPCRTVTGL